MNRPLSQDITGVILAGGRAQRMGGVDKGLIELSGKPLLEHVIVQIKPQVDRLIINANRNLALYAAYSLPVVCDEPGDFRGPLAGMLSAMRVADTAYILTVPCDCPLLPSDLALRMVAALKQNDAKICVAHNGQAVQPVFALIPCHLADDIRAYLASGERKLETWLARHQPALVDFSDQPQAFANINTPEDIMNMEQQLKFSN